MFKIISNFFVISIFIK